MPSLLPASWRHSKVSFRLSSLLCLGSVAIHFTVIFHFVSMSYLLGFRALLICPSGVVFGPPDLNHDLPRAFHKPSAHAAAGVK
jgi:hypothetical protein